MSPAFPLAGIMNYIKPQGTCEQAHSNREAQHGANHDAYIAKSHIAPPIYIPQILQTRAEDVRAYR